MNDPISNSILLTMVLIIVLCVALIAVLAVVAVRYLGTLVDQGNVAEDHMNVLIAVQREFNERDALHRSSQAGPLPDAVVQPVEPIQPEGVRRVDCGRGDVHPAHIGVAKTRRSTGERVWCPGMTQAQSDEADRLAQRETEMFHPDYEPLDVALPQPEPIRLDGGLPHHAVSS